HKRRWCELVISAPSAAPAFMQVFPAARFVCVHRACTDVISAAIAAQPWGLVSPVMSRFTASYPGHSGAAAAAHCASATQQLLALEAASRQASSRVRYEDVVADAEHAWDSVRSSLHLNQQTHQKPLPRLPVRTESAREDQRGGHLQIPVHMIPAELRKQIDH